MSAPVLILVTRPVEVEPGGEPGEAHPSATAAPYRLADVSAPQLSVLDLGVTRGDGVFESVRVGPSGSPDLEAHLRRFVVSASLLDLPTPDLAVWRRAFAAAVTEARRRFADDEVLGVKLVLTRGIEGRGLPTAWVLAQPAPDHTAVRRDGVAAITLDRGYRHDAGATSPWLLLGAKTLSYEVAAAATREAARRGAREVVFASSDGFVLEAPTSSVVVRFGDRVVSPPAEVGIIAGTTVTRALDFFARRGFETAEERIPVADLTRADAIWLVSSVRQAVPLTALDGRPLALDPTLTAALNTHLGT